MRKLISILLLGALLSLVVVNTLAISEVTPVPAEPTEPPAPTATPQPTATPVPPPTSAPNGAQPDGNATQLIGQATELITSGDPAGAIELLTEAIQLEPLNDQAYVFRGIANGLLERWQRAIDDYSQAIELRDYEFAYYRFRANAYRQLGDFGNAYQDFSDAIEINPRFAGAFADRAELNRLLGDAVEAAIDETMAEGIAQWQQFGDFAGAVVLFSEAIDAQSSQASTVAAAYYNRALALSNLGDDMAAVEDYTLALEAVPGMHDAYLARGISYRLLDDVLNAGRDFIERIRLLESKSFRDEIAPGVPLDVSMSHGAVYRITFAGDAGDVVTLAARDLDGVGVDPLIALLDPEGEAIAGDDDFGGFFDAEIADFELPTTGTYTLVVSHANGGFDGMVRVTLD